MFKFIVILSVMASTVSMADRLPVDDSIDGLRAKASHLEMLKTLFQSTQCVADMGNNQVALSAGALRDNGIVMAVSPTIKGQYLAFSSAPKPQFLRNVIQHTLQQVVGRVFIISSSLKAAPGADSYTHLGVKLAEPVITAGFKDPVTMKDTYTYQQYEVAIPLSEIKKGISTTVLGLKTGGSFQVICK